MNILETKGDVFADGHGRINRIVLENHCHSAFARLNVRDIPAADQDPSRCLRADPRDHAEQRCFAAPGGADEYCEGSVLNREVHAADYCVVAKLLCHILKLYRCHRCSCKDVFALIFIHLRAAGDFSLSARDSAFLPWFLLFIPALFASQLPEMEEFY